jgi:hypothetical protein
LRFRAACVPSPSYAVPMEQGLLAQLRLLRSRLGRIIRDIGRKIAGQPALEEAFGWPLTRARQIRAQQQRQRGFKFYSMPRKWSASARARRGRLMNSGSRSRSLPPMPAPPAVSSCWTRQHCRAIPMTTTPLSGIDLKTLRQTTRLAKNVAFQCRVAGKTLRSSRPLRTARASFPASGSSIRQHVECPPF